MQSDIAGMSPAQARAWLALVAMGELLPAALDAQLTADAGLINFEYAILTFLARAGDQTLRMGDLALAVSSPAPRLSKAVNRLEQRGLVERVSCPSDGRAINVHLTEEGRQVWRVASKPHIVLARDTILGDLSPEQLTALADLLEPILTKLDPGHRFGSVPRHQSSAETPAG